MKNILTLIILGLFANNVNSQTSTTESSDITISCKKKEFIITEVEIFLEKLF